MGLSRHPMFGSYMLLRPIPYAAASFLSLALVLLPQPLSHSPYFAHHGCRGLESSVHAYPAFVVPQYRHHGIRIERARFLFLQQGGTARLPCPFQIGRGHRFRAVRRGKVEHLFPVPPSPFLGVLL